MRLYLAAPDPDAFVSGGNTYNRNLGGALREMGLAVAISPLIPENPESGDLVVVDSILFDKISPETKIGRNHIALLHHLESLYPLNADRFEQVERPVLSRFSRFIATSDFTRRYLQSRGFARERIIVIEPVAPSLPIYQPPSTGKINALILANIVRRKGILEFLTELAAASVPPDYVLRIVGNTKADVDYAQKCADLARNDRILSKTVSFLGLQDDTAIDKIWSRSNLFISASFMETFGMSIQEACIRHIPCLVLDRGHCAAHIRPGLNGFAFGSMPELVSKFDSLVRSQSDFQALVTTSSDHQPVYARSWMDQAKRLIEFI